MLTHLRESPLVSWKHGRSAALGEVMGPSACMKRPLYPVLARVENHLCATPPGKGQSYDWVKAISDVLTAVSAGTVQCTFWYPLLADRCLAQKVRVLYSEQHLPGDCAMFLRDPQRCTISVRRHQYDGCWYGVGAICFRLPGLAHCAASFCPRNTGIVDLKSCSITRQKDVTHTMPSLFTFWD